MADKSSPQAASNAVPPAGTVNAAEGAASSTAAPKKPIPEGNPALRMMGEHGNDIPYSLFYNSY